MAYHGYFDELPLDHRPEYVINEDLVHAPFGETRVQRLYVQHVSCLAPHKQGKSDD